METVTPNEIVVTLPYGNAVPCLYEILKRFKNLYPRQTYLEPVLNACAEESEKMMHERMIMKVRPSVMVRRQYLGNRMAKIKGYQCPSCKSEKIRLNDNYCPACAMSIAWR